MIIKLLVLFSVAIAWADTSPTINPSPSPKIPFWKAKFDVYQKLKEERAIIVSAKTEEIGEKQKLILISAGRISAPETFTYDKLLEFNKYSEFLPYIKESVRDSRTGNVYIHAELLGYAARMTVKMTNFPTSSGHKIHWESISGSFVGMSGDVITDSVDGGKTEISMDSNFIAVDLGIPTFILKWGLEFAGRRAASSMRSHIEDLWAESLKKSH